MTDIWWVNEESETADILDENRLLVATAHDFDQARDIAREHNAHAQLLEALRTAYNDLTFLAVHDEKAFRVRKAIGAAIAKAEVSHG